MQYFKDNDKNVYAYDEAQLSQGYPLTPMVRMTSEEVYAHLSPPKTDQQLRDEWKLERSALVAAIKVKTAAGHTFDGDEVSQGRMARAVVALNAAPAGTTVNWVLSDNSVIEADASELTEALALAGAAQAELWVLEA